MHFVQADKVELRAAQPTQHVVQEARAYFEEPVGLKTIQPGGTHVMERQNYAEPPNERAHEVVGSAEIERFEAAANQGFME
jgi:hypothetical protein